jgi:5-oxoprolinase (ATP-hydrolysing)
MVVDPARSRMAFEALAAELEMTIEEASYGTVRIACHAMEQAIEENSVRKGFDPRDFVLVAGGGAGPLFGALVAEECGIPAVVVPVHPGAIAALGLLSTDIAYEFVATVHQNLAHADLAGLEAHFLQLEERAREQLERDGIAADQCVFERAADCRYVGQGYELRVECPSGAVDDAWIAEVSARFHAAHEREYSRSFPDSAVEMPNVRVRGVGLMEPLQSPTLSAGDEAEHAAERRTGLTWFEVDGTLQELSTGFYSREDLRAGNVVTGPAVVNQYDSTTVIPPGVVGRVDSSGTMVLERSERSDA